MRFIFSARSKRDGVANSAKRVTDFSVDRFTPLPISAWISWASKPPYPLWAAAVPDVAEFDTLAILQRSTINRQPSTLTVWYQLGTLDQQARRCDPQGVTCKESGCGKLRQGLRLSQAALRDELNRRLGRSYDNPKISRWENGREPVPDDVADELDALSTGQVSESTGDRFGQPEGRCREYDQRT